MNILVGKTFGIGNAICAIPMIKAIKSLGHNVDILIGSHPDDFGSNQVLKGQGELLIDSADDRVYDLAIMAMPFDGRWKNNVHYRAKEVWDERPRPDPTTMGFSSWKRHEVEYQMDWARKLGYTGETPDCSFIPKREANPNLVYVGVGYKKDQAGFWKVKHWGNENFAQLIKMLLDSDPELRVVSTGNTMDMVVAMAPIFKLVGDPRYSINVTNVQSAFTSVCSSGLYVGNDTGMAHVAASCDRKVAVIFKMENAATKSHPWCRNYRVVEAVNREVSPEEMFAVVQELRNG